MDTYEKNQTIDSSIGTGGSLPGRLEHRPGVRRAGKLLLDGALAASAWCLSCALLRHGTPTLRGTGFFAGLALAVNLALGFTSQHYRLVGFAEAWALLRAPWSSPPGRWCSAPCTATPAWGWTARRSSCRPGCSPGPCGWAAGWRP
ncbi:MAG: hypothetical protein ABSH53_18785 [Holophaga sp.]|jgi:hypothetical protein